MFSQSLLHENHQGKTAHFVERKKHDISLLENRVKMKKKLNFLLFFPSLVKLKELRGKMLNHAFQVLQKKKKVVWCFGFLGEKKSSEVQTSNKNWRKMEN